MARTPCQISAAIRESNQHRLQDLARQGVKLDFRHNYTVHLLEALCGPDLEAVQEDWELKLRDQLDSIEEQVKQQRVRQTLLAPRGAKV